MAIIWGFLISMIIIAAVILGYKKLRPLFPVKVNCWFCSHDTRVPFGNKNCWDCPYCEQYNGFTPDGDYNKPVPAQYTEEINHPISCEPTEFLTRSQFLCPACQRNQLLKVKQLATFEALNEATYDEEIAFYTQHLEKVYALCPLCDSFVKRELERQDDSLNKQPIVSEGQPCPTGSWVEPEPMTTTVHKILPLLQLLPWAVSLSTSVCTLLLVGMGMEDYYSSRPDGTQGWLTGEVTEHVDRQGIALCGLVLCVVSKLMYGKHRLHVGDAVHIVLWVVVVVVGLLLSPHLLDLCLSTLLLTLELCLFFRHRHPSSVTAPIMKRLSLEGGACGANSDAVSEAVSSVSTSCRQRGVSPFLDSGDGNGVSVLNALSREKPTASSTTQGLFGDKTRVTAKKTGDLEVLGKGVGSILIGPHSSESGYSSGKSSVFNSKAFGPVTQPTFSTGSPFPRPLILPPRLSVVSFTQPSRSNLWSQSSAFSGGVGEHSPANKGGHINPFLAQESRPLSMFSPTSSRKDRTLSNISNLMPQPPTTSTTSGYLFSTMDTSKTVFQTKAASEVNFSVHGKKPSHSRATATWWRSSASDIMEKKHDQPLIRDSKDIQSREVDSSGDKSEDVTNAFTKRDTALSNIIPTECDSTTPLLSQLKISTSPKKRKKKKISKQPIKETVDSFVFSDDEEEEHVPQSSPSSVSTVILQTKQDWGWLQWLAVGVMVISVIFNLFLTWTMWASKPQP